jgi:hypothetical protein
MRCRNAAIEPQMVQTKFYDQVVEVSGFPENQPEFDSSKSGNEKSNVYSFEAPKYCSLTQGGCLKKVTDLIMIYFIEPKQPTNLEASCRIMQSVKRQPSDRKVVGSIPAHTSGFFGFLFLFPKKKYVRAFSQPETTNQPVVIFGIMRSEKRKKSALVVVE